VTEQRVWFGSQGPFLYDDTDAYGSGITDPTDPEYDSTLLHGIRVSDQMYVETAPSQTQHVLRYGDWLSALTHEAVSAVGALTEGELVTLTGSGWYKAVGNDEARPAHAVVTGTSSPYRAQFLGRVLVKLDASSYPVGSALFLSTSSGCASHRPLSGALLQYIGFVVEAAASGFAYVMFNPERGVIAP